MSGYRKNESLWKPPADQWTLPYISARLGFGLLPISFVILISESGLIASGVTALIGAALLTYGLRNY